MQEISREKD